MTGQFEAQRREIELANPQDWPNVTIIVLNWNGWRDTLTCLNSVMQLTYPNYLTIIVDNGSRDDSVETIKTWARENLGEGHVCIEYTRAIALRGGEESSEESLACKPSKSRMVLIQNEENLGFAGGNNVAIHYALNRKFPGDYIFLLNNDAKLEKDCLMHMVNVIRKMDAGVVGPVVKEDPNGKIQFAGYNGSFPLIRQFFQPITSWPEPTLESEKECWICFWVSGVAMLIRKSVLRDVYSSTGRYLDDRLFLYGEDFEFCYIASKKGYKSMIAKHGVIYHKTAGSSGGQYSPIDYYYSNRNRVLLANKLLPMFWRLLFHLVNVPVCFIRVLKNVIHRRPHSARAILCALADGYRGVAGKWEYHNHQSLK